jgi:hypothetical protein
MTMQVPNQLLAQLYSAPSSDTKSAAAPDTVIVPSLRVAQRYDSNVFFAPGTNLEDYVTTVSPQLRLSHRGQWVEGVVSGGVIGEVYAKNPDLNYVGGSGSVDLNLDGPMNRLVQGLGLRVADTFIYTPQPLAFTAPTSGNQIPPAFVQGIQVQRVNAFSNAAKVDASYRASEYQSLNVTYLDRRIRFGNPFATPTGATEGGFINTNFQTITSGLVRKLSPADTIFLSYQYQHATYSDALGSQFSTQGALVRWSSLITPALKATGEGGFAAISSSGYVAPQGAASVEWEGQYTSVMVSYSQTIAPSFLFVATPLLSQVVAGSVKRQITEPLSLSVTGTYAVNKSVPDSSLIQFESYAISPSINYVISKTYTATLSYTRSQFEQTAASGSFPFDRNIVQLSLVAEWK